MSIAAVIAIIIAAASGLLGVFFGRGLGKSAGRKEGEIAAVAEQQVTQAKEVVKAVQERNNVEAEVSSLADDELDARLQRHDRSDRH